MPRAMASFHDSLMQRNEEDASRQQRFDHVDIPLPGGQRKWPHPVRIDSFNVGTSLHQPVDQLIPPKKARDQQVTPALNDVRAEGAARLAEALNDVKAEGAAWLAEALKINSTLTTLHLALNNVSTEGATRLAESLQTNSTLVALDLSFNELGNEGIKPIAEALLVNSSLSRLDISGSQLVGEGVTLLEQAVMFNRSLTQVAFNFGDKRVLVDAHLDRNQANLKLKSVSLFALLLRWLPCCTC